MLPPGAPIPYDLPRVEPLNLDATSIPVAEPVSASRSSMARDYAPVVRPIPLPVSHIAMIGDHSPTLSASSASAGFVLQNGNCFSQSASDSPRSVQGNGTSNEGRRAMVVTFNTVERSESRPADTERQLFPEFVGVVKGKWESKEACLVCRLDIAAVAGGRRLEYVLDGCRRLYNTELDVG